MQDGSQIDFEKTFDRIARGENLSLSELVEIADGALDELCALARRIRENFLGSDFETCSIMNAKSGACSENCKWCSQSAHNFTGVRVYSCVSKDSIMEQFFAAKKCGIGRFSLVTSGRSLSDSDLEKMAEAFADMKNEGGMDLCGSFGLLSERQLAILFEAGMTRYHCNLETAPSKFSELCQSHTIEDKLETIFAARKVGLKVCSGGIIGMGETRAQRAELAHAVRLAGAVSIPVNVLQAIKGTPLENLEPLSNDEILRSFAVFKIANPTAHIRFAAGRLAMKDIQEKAMFSGVSAMLTGDMLTTTGSKTSDDFALLKSLGFNLK